MGLEINKYLRTVWQIVRESRLAYRAIGSVRSAVSNPNSQEEEEDTYDPRNPEYILPASTIQVEEINMAMFQHQIFRLQGAISQRKNKDEDHILEHYRKVLFHLQYSLQAVLDRRDRAGMRGDPGDADANRGSSFVADFPVL